LTSSNNVQLLRDHFTAKEKLDREALTAQFTEDAQWWPPVSGAMRGLAERPVGGGAFLGEMLTTLSVKLYDRARTWDVKYAVADEGSGAVMVELTTTLSADGSPYVNTYVYFFRFESGKIAEVWEFLDTAYAFSLFDAAGKNA
jgi:ketosteroid isomerase-like protein